MVRCFTHPLVQTIFFLIQRVYLFLLLGEDFDRNSSLLEYEILELLG